MIEAIKNLAYDSKNLLLPMWYLKSPPVSRSITKNRPYLSWNAQFMLTRKGCFKSESSSLSFITDWTLFFPITFVFSISFIANSFLVLLDSTHQTFPKPPFPITYKYSKWSLLVYFCSIITLFCYFYCRWINFERSILKHSFACRLDGFLQIPDLVLECSFDFFSCFKLT